MSRIDDLIKRIDELEEEMQVEFDRRRKEFRFVVEDRRIRFAEDVARLQRASKTGTWRYLVDARPVTWLTAPVIYFGLVPMFGLDLFLSVYQAICFPVYRIPKVKRSDYMALDRGDLPYLNPIERWNCFYCGYGNGLAGYFREISARTEQYWCPIKHARRIKDTHELYPGFFEYGDAESYRLGLKRLREKLQELE